MIYVIQITDRNGEYIARRHFHHSYTKKLENARGFSSLERAYKEGLCENERVVAIDSIIQVEDGD